MSIPGVDLRVEIAFDSGFRTPDVDRTWTDVSDYVELEDALSITYGRQDEISVADANQLTLTLDNTDGRFTYGNASSPYYPNLKIGRPIRVTAIIDAVEHVRFTGYINEWPTEWPSGGEEYATASISASSRLSRLGLTSAVGHYVDAPIESARPAYYWPLTDAAGSTSAFESHGSAPLSVGSPTVTFGVGGEEEPPITLGADDRGAVQLSRGTSVDSPVGASIGATLPTPIPVAPSTGVSVAFFHRNLGPDGYVSGARKIVELSSLDGWVRVRWTSVTVSDYSTNLQVDFPFELGLSLDLHHIALTLSIDGAGLMTLTAYLDGVLVGSDSSVVAVTPFDLEQIVARGVDDYLPYADNILIGRLGVWDRALSADEVEGMADVAFGALGGETTDERLERYGVWAGIPSSEVVTTPSPIEMSMLGTDGAQLVDLMRQVETTEAGVLFDDRDGNLVLLPRSARYGVPVGLTLDASAERVGADYAPKVDRQGLANVGRGTNALGTVDVAYTDEASREEYGDAAYDVESSALYDAEPLHLISWQINANSEPRPRAPSVTIDVLPYLDEPDLASILNADIGTKVRVANAPTQAPEVTADYFAEGYTETFGEANWSISLNLSPVAPYDDVLVLDSATDGLLDTDVLAL